ncbi:hypothetical protein INT47_012572 [Mucor saturninus]|uniref:Uncharacterized protein n=1 Tax=Mucor saturninus TaxID=64648 RepID=A0A8H7R1L5_9FUNG|nr:hypothetical protein INT47_012572 [Mucor saturninus]
MDSSAKLNELAESVQDQNNEDRVKEEQDIPMPIQMLPERRIQITVIHISKLCDTDGGITGYTVDIEILYVSMTDVEDVAKLDIAGT